MRCTYTVDKKEIVQNIRTPMFQEVDMATKFLDKEIIYPVNAQIGKMRSFSDNKFCFELNFIYNLKERSFYKNTNRTVDQHEFYQAVDNALRPVTREQVLSDQGQLRRDFDLLAAEVKSLRELIKPAEDSTKNQSEKHILEG